MTDGQVRALERDLVRLVEGTVTRAVEPGYVANLANDNGRISHSPYLIVIPSNSGDVARIVGYCHVNKVRFTVKSGGHCAAGYCLNSDGIVLDLSRLSSVGFGSDKSTLSVGMGARWIQIYDFL